MIRLSNSSSTAALALAFAVTIPACTPHQKYDLVNMSAPQQVVSSGLLGCDEFSYHASKRAEAWIMMLRPAYRVPLLGALRGALMLYCSNKHDRERELKAQLERNIDRIIALVVEIQSQSSTAIEPSFDRITDLMQAGSNSR